VAVGFPQMKRKLELKLVEGLHVVIGAPNENRTRVINLVPMFSLDS